MAEWHEKRLFSRDWELPDDIHAQGVKILKHWLDNECENPDLEISKPFIFRAMLARWDR
jgi:hypothetical protein